MTQLVRKTVSLREVYANIYPWKTLEKFVEQLRNTIAYQSDDGLLLAIHKPFGVGIYTAKDNNTSKQNQDKLLQRLVGQPRYSITDALEPLSDSLNLKKPLHIVRAIDRYMSGIVLLSTDKELMEKKLAKSRAFSRVNSLPTIGTRCIASGIPTINKSSIEERVGVELLEVDELGDYKEPIIVEKITRKHRLMQFKDHKQYLARLTVKKVNRELAVSYLELHVSSLKWDFPRCYISSKTSFILGDVRFSKRIREILGQKMQVSAFKSSHRYDDNYEPLNSKLRSRLGVSRNASIPLMLDVHSMHLRNFNCFGEKELLIKSPYLPIHFALTAEKLNLIDLNENCDDKE